MIRKIITSWLLIVYTFFNTGCQADEPDNAPQEITEVETEKNHLVKTELLANFTAANLQMIASAFGYTQFNSELKYDMAVYRMHYLTTYQGKEIEATGLFCVPTNNPDPAPVLSAQHGTTFEEADAPSNFSGGLSGFELFASGGYITVIPDFIGYGASRNIFHPYYDQKHSALAVVDMIKAAKQYCSKEQVKVNDQLFLAGYSEGGYVTLAAQREIETNPAHRLKITAVAAGAGGYDLTQMLDMVSTGNEYSNPAYLAFVLLSYNNTYNWNRPLTDFFREPYASRLPGLFDGNHSGSQINRQLAKDPDVLFNPNFFAGVTGEGENVLKQALYNNSFFNWVPKAPLRMYHGTSDEVVPFRNSEIVYQRFSAAGATNVTFHPIQNGTHGSSLGPMLNSVIPWMRSFTNKL